ncbi:type II/IV secretion system protein [Candidatus Berkelbacteria bacterium]|nr:type II/IV secretion system protein [Candidatus Berkelbacteria bacterium]
MVRQKDLLDILIELQSVSVDEAEFLRRRWPAGAELSRVLLKKGVVTEPTLAKAFALLYQLPFVHLIGKQIPQQVLKIIPYNLAAKYQMVVYEFTAAHLKIAVGQPSWLHTSPTGPLHQLARSANLVIELAITTPKDIAWALKGYEQEKLKAIRQPADSNVKTEAAAKTPADVLMIDLRALTIPLSVLSKFPKDVARKYQMVVFDAPSERQFKVAAINPTDPKLIEILKFLKDRNEIAIELYRTDIHGFEKAMMGYDKRPVRTIERSIERFDKIPAPTLGAAGAPVPAAVPVAAAPPVIPTGLFETEDNDLDAQLPKPPQSAKELEVLVTSGFIPKILAGMIALAVKEKASDIHLEPSETDFRLRIRVDGVLKELLSMPLALQPPVVSRIKILSKMKIDEQRIPQDGRFDVKVLGHEVDIRVSSLPTVHGEKMALRLLDKSVTSYTLEQIGLTGGNLKRVTDAISRPWGIVLVTGPTGSGKTTTLYACLRKLISDKVNIITLEDPVEYEIAGVNQTQVKPKIGFSFAEGLRSVLRQDPNIIMVGEIRDSETASLATHAALTGHLVLTTLHTNDAPGALPRLTNMGVEPFLITSAINAIAAQRLARRLCTHCRKPAKVPAAVFERVTRELANIPEATSKPITLYQAAGCKECGNSGYSGRVGIFEVLVMTSSIEEATVNRKPADEVRVIAIKEGMVTMRQDGLLKALQGLTTLEEVMKITE